MSGTQAKVQPTGIDKANTILLGTGSAIILLFIGDAFGADGVIFLLLFSTLPALAAYNKGEKFINWYFYGILIWIVAMIHSVIIKDTGRKKRFF